MAVRITHTNNSSGHDGTYVYRSTSPMTPGALPAPVVDAPPVAQGATFEYIDSPTDGTYYYRTQDHEGGQVSAVSAEVSIAVGDDYSTAQVGDEIGGGIYAGTITYADARQFHIVAAKASGEVDGFQWGNYGETSGANDPDDGLANQTELLTNWDDGSLSAFYHCRDYNADGNQDWYMPAKQELALVSSSLSGHAEFSDNTSSGDDTYSSTELDATRAYSHLFSTDSGNRAQGKNSTVVRTRPIRRVAV